MIEPMDEKQNKLQKLRTRADSALSQIIHVENIETKSIDSLLHEIEVYQIELELQHDELQTTQNELARSHRELEDLFDFAPLTYLILNKQGIIQRANLTATLQFGMARAALEGSLFAERVAPEDQDKFYLYQRRLIYHHRSQVSDFLLMRQDGSTFYGRVEGVPKISDEEGDTFRIAINDISQRKSYEKRLQGLRELDHAILGTQSVVEVIKVAAHHLLELTQASQASILLFEPTQSLFHVFTQLQGETELNIQDIMRDEILPSYVSHEHRVLQGVGAVPHQPEIHTLLTIPIFQSEIYIGSIWLRAATSEFFTENIIQIGEDVGQQIGIAVQQARLFQQVQQHAIELETRVEARTQELSVREQSEHEQRILAEAMLGMARNLNSTLDLDQVLEGILVNLERVIAYDRANIILIRRGTGHVVKWRGNHPPELEKTIDIELDVRAVPVFRHILQTKKSLITNEIELGHPWVRANAQSSDAGGLQTYLGVPIQFDQAVHGILNIYLPHGHTFNPGQLGHIEAFAEHAAIAVNNAELHQNKQHLAVLQERQRLARDLHDAVSQTLFTLRIMSETVASKPHQYDLSSTEMLQHIVLLASGAQAEMDMLLYELRPVDSKDVQIVDLLNRLVRAFKGRKHIPILLKIEGEIPRLADDVKMEMYRIAQEALNNVNKYAEAKEVEILLISQDEHLSLSINDTGVGYDVQAAQQRGHGLSIMHERAEKIGAELTITSEMGVGTQVKVTLQI